MLIPDIEVVRLSLIICWNYARRQSMFSRSYPILPYSVAMAPLNEAFSSA